MNESSSPIAGCLVGMAIGDALGLPREGLSPQRSARLFSDFERFHFLFGRGMFSDDTELACMTAQALLVSGGDSRRFLNSLSWRLRWWLLGIPFSLGKATLQACLKLWLGFNGKNSGVWSAGNGPATRALLIGVCFSDRPDLVHFSTRITHRDPKAEWGALALARAAHLASQRVEWQPEALARAIVEVLPPEATELRALIERAAISVRAGQTTEHFGQELGFQNGVSGYMFHTVPVALHAWLFFPNDYRDAVQAVIRCGGDTDSTAAVVGSLAGARLGTEAIPIAWRRSLCEWPRDLRWIERLGRELAKMVADGQPRRGVPLSVVGIVARNLLFDLTVLMHIVRRLLPPY